jgi:uncharacterized protein YndB with AHSA1/START domain
LAELQIAHEIRIRASAGAVYDALTDPRQLARWWIPDTRGVSRAGQQLQFWFSSEGCQIVRVAELRPERVVRWRVPDDDGSEWAGTQIEFALQQGDGHTRVIFRHSGWQREIERFPYYSMSWAVFLVSLKDLLQKGKGYPFPNEWIHE